ADGRLRRHHRRPGCGCPPQPLLSDPAAPGALLFRRHPLCPHRQHGGLPAGGHRHVLRLAGGPERHQHAGQSGHPLGLCGHLHLRRDPARPAPLRSSSPLLHALSAHCAARFMAGKFPLMIFGLPGAALAMYRTARPEKRKAVAGLLLSAALTSMITGITEPLEFTFLFVAPLMYAVHCVYAGLAYMLMHILNVCVGMTFSGGLIDLTLFGILQGNDKTHWIWVVVVGAVYFVVYYLTFSAMIVRMDLKTPGREA